MALTVLAVGDVVGRSGIEYLKRRLHSIKKMNGADFTVVNGENASGLGITPSQAEEIFNAGADVITLGNHTWDRDGISEYLDDCPYILRPLNYVKGTPGRGVCVYETPMGKIRIINLIGRCKMDFGPDNPFLAADAELKRESCAVTLVDFHAEATSEKIAMAYYLDGRVSAVWGTHTHVQTADARIMPKGTGYISDLGMTGPAESVIGVKPENSITFFTTSRRVRFEQAPGPCYLECALYSIDARTGLCENVRAMRITD
ncbi:MAG: TIGR00282 family metallophosphoesterase [Clostridiales bacterium]|nr:TIGR00282 family metallophosphoesterase [Clostridiales bacterium]